MNMKDYKAAWNKKYPDGKIEFGFNAIAGYTTGLSSRRRCRSRPASISSNCAARISASPDELKTLDGTYALDETGGQIGELTPLGQLILDEHGHLKFVSIYPHETATGKPVYPRP